MSKTIDQKVVEMRFDNKHFEQHTKESMSTLEKLKQKLKLTEASKGLENLNKSANKVDMKGMSGALDTVHSKFSALEVMGVTALANITNSAVNAGKRMVKALTVDPVMDGFNEYEMTLNAIQTTMAATGKTSKEVQEQLKELDTYADKTVYSTADMLNNLPKFTNAGVELESATKAMIGIANATALAGGDAGKASIAFYNLGQAIGTGYLTRMDYNSINNAGIATMEWKNQMVEAAIAAGTLTKVGDDLYDTGGKQLTLQQLFIDGLQEQWATTEVMMKVFGDYGDETTEIGKKSYAAAQDIKTFSMMMDSLKATAGTGWKDTWEIVFGDLEEAKELWTGLSDFISGIITGAAKIRNGILEGALGKSFKGLFDNIKKPFEQIEKTVSNIKNYAGVVDEIIGGKWGNGQQRWDALTKAGYDWAHAQNLVNEKLGVSLRRTTSYKEAQEGVAKTQEQVNEANTDYILDLFKLSDAELRDLGYKEDQIAAFRELERVAKQTGIPLRTFIENIDEIDGRWILLNSFKNIGQGLVAVFGAMKDAWLDIFPVDRTANGLFNAIAGFHKFTTYLKVNKKAADNLRDTFKGVFAILDMTFTIIGGPVKLALKLFMQLFKALGIGAGGVLELTGAVGRAVTKFHDWFNSIFDFTEVFKYLVPYLKIGATAVKDFVVSIAKSDTIKRFTDYLRKSKESIKEWLKGIKDAKDIPKYIFQGLMNGFSSGAKSVIDFIVNFAKQILTKFRKVLRIESPSKEFYEIGKYIVQGLFNGISDFIKMVYSLVMSIGGKLIDIVRDLDLGSIFTIAVGSASVYGFVKLAQALEALTSPIEAFADIAETFNKTLKKFNGVLNSFKFKMYAEAIKTFAIAIAILAGSIVVLSMLDQGKMWSAIGGIVVLGIVLGGLTAVAGKFGGAEGVQFGKMALTLLALGVAMSLMASALKKVASIDPKQYGQAVDGFVGIITSLLLVMYMVNKNEKGFDKLGSSFLGIAAAFLMMGYVIKILGKLKPEEISQGMLAVLSLGIIIAGLIWATKLMGDAPAIDGIGKTISKIAGAILMMAVVVKILGNMDMGELIQGGFAVIVLSGIIAGLMAATNLLAKGFQSASSISKIGKALLGIGGAMLMMAFVAKICGSMSIGELAKGIVAIGIFSLFIAGLMKATSVLGDKELIRVGRTILMVSVAVGLMGITATLLGLIDTEKLAKGIIAVGFLSAFVAGLIYATKFVPKGITGTLITITVAIGILALSLGLLSMINPTKLLGASVAIGIVLGMFALVIAASSMAKAAMGSLIVLTVAIGILALSLGLLSLIDTTKLLATTLSLTSTLLSLTVMLGVLGLVGTLGPAAFIGIGALATLIIGLTALAAGIGYLMETFPALQSFIDNGLPVLIKIAGGLGEMVGAFVSGALVQISGALPVIGTNLSLFMTNLAPFIAGAKMIDLDVLAGVGILAASILALTVTELVTGILSFLSIGTSLADLGTQLSQFMINAMPFIMLSRSIDPTIMEGVKTLAEAILILTGANLLEGIGRLFSGKNSLENFGSQLAGLGTSMNQFATNLGTFDESKLTTVNCACKAIKALAQAASEIPNEGGLWAKIAGDNSLAVFGSKLPGLAEHINGFITNLGTFDESKLTTVDCACRAIKALAQAASEIPNEGGLWGALCGENSLATFGSKLPGLAKHLNGFITNLGTFDETKITTVNCVCKAIKSLANAANTIPNEGGLWAKIVGDNSLATFGSKLPGLATNMGKFVKNLGVFTEEQVATVNSACKAIKAIANLGKIDIENTGDGLSAFGRNMVQFAKKIKSFVEHVSEVGGKSIDSAIKKTKDLLDMAKTIASTNVSSLKTFGESLKKVAKDGVKGFVKEFSGESPKAQAIKATKALLDAGIKGAESKRAEVKKKFKSIAQTAVDAMCTVQLKADASDAGKDLVRGFANGIKNNKHLATSAGSSIGKAALKAAKEAIDSNSPSKEAEKLGNYFGQGLVIGIDDYTTKTYDAAYSVGDYAKKGLSNAISRISSLITDGMDTQPTIRPVLDLSDVESGAGYLSSMFNNSAFGVNANLNAISMGMRSRNQNGANSDVVSAIDGLRKDLGNIGGTTNNYNVNGVTYDDGSNITDAVRTLVRAATMERRV